MDDKDFNDLNVFEDDPGQPLIFFFPENRHERLNFNGEEPLTAVKNSASD